MKRKYLIFMRLNQTRWKDRGDFTSEDILAVSAKVEENQLELVMILNKPAAKRVRKVVQNSDRMILIRLEAELMDVMMVQVFIDEVCMDEVEHNYKQLEEFMDKKKGGECLVVMFDWNVVMGKYGKSSEAGKSTLRRANTLQREREHVEFCSVVVKIYSSNWKREDTQRKPEYIVSSEVYKSVVEIQGNREKKLSASREWI